MGALSDRLIPWYQQHGRHDLPWKVNPTPYRVWVSEIMLQQTQVVTVLPYYQRFISQFPDLKTLAVASLDAVLFHWSGLGYYARARNLHKTAQIIHFEHEGRFPSDVDQLSSLPGIGRSTAGAIVSFSMQLSAAILDGNVQRVLMRYYAIEGWAGHSKIKKQLWNVAEKNTPTINCQHYNQAIMDLGAVLCTRQNPKCSSCPISVGCQAYLQHKVTQIPHPKPKKSKPIQHRRFLLLRRKSASGAHFVFLERRPMVGIWAGLWTFPECLPSDNVQTLCQEKYAIHVDQQECWDTISHTLTHFQLEMTPVLLEVTLAETTVMDTDSQIWHILGDTLPGGIASPVLNLLERLQGVI